MIDVRPKLIRLPAMKAAHFQTNYEMSESDCNHVIRNMGRVSLTMAECANRVFGSGRAMRVGGRADSRIAHGRFDPLASKSLNCGDSGHAALATIRRFPR